jgi:hypothetical protein
MEKWETLYFSGSFSDYTHIAQSAIELTCEPTRCSSAVRGCDAFRAVTMTPIV